MTELILKTEEQTKRLWFICIKMVRVDQQQDYHDRAEDEIHLYSLQPAGFWRKCFNASRSEKRLLVSGSDESLSASVGEDITLNCSVDSHITPEHTEKVLWQMKIKIFWLCSIKTMRFFQIHQMSDTETELSSSLRKSAKETSLSD
ncbi:Tyrosine-protein phosphatase non-receptor type substrate 1 [Labeo rohita]|uniref:Tyrosine-protein phosphatase non-receptor type substrate 1 n=1 Tax=Labeo rohita TaxID=84645 RepID=A0ABQ8L8K3_LABRO|nr:Tyrosine-protein phosphatase non-receptor type substrate 1 [Labeo rohita]